MVKYRCGICSREFSTTGGLRQHGNARHGGRTTLSRRPDRRPQRLEPTRPEHDEILWNTPIVMPQMQSQLQSQSQSSISSLLPLPTLEETSVDDNDDHVIEDVIPEDNNINESEPRYNLRSRKQDVEMEENIEENDESSEENVEELETESQLSEEINFDPEDLQGASLDDALETIKGKNKPERIAKWPNDAYRDFMKLIVDSNIRTPNITNITNIP